MADLESRKYRLIETVFKLQNEHLIEMAESFFQKLLSSTLEHEILRPMRKTLSIEALIEEQNYTGFSWEDHNRLVDEIALEEPIDELLSLI